MQSKRGFLQVIALVWLITFPSLVVGQIDTNELQVDSLQTDSDSLQKPDSTSESRISESAIESKVVYVARDTIKYNFETSMVFLHGDAIVTYENIELRAEYIRLHLDSNIVYAIGVKDSSGKVVGSPIFKEGGKEFKSQRMTYNFKTKKGKIHDVITQEGEGYIHGEDVKKNPDDVIYIENGRYTTCDNEDPHFSIWGKKLKIIPKDKIVAKPANLIIADVNTPIYVPFAIFPNREGGKSGIIVPMPGESVRDGFFIQNAGYYVYLGEKADLNLEMDIYTKGGLTFRPSFNYRKRYKRSGSIQGRYRRSINGIVPEDPNYSITNDYQFTWRHQQETQAHPNSNFGADVNIHTQTAFQNDVNTSDRDYLAGNFTSSINYSRYFFQDKVNLKTYLRHNQNNSSGALNLDLPEITLGVTRMYPFKSRNSVKQRWYHKIGLSYTGNFKNKLSVSGDGLIVDDDTLALSYENRQEVLNEFQNGIQHSIPVTTNFKILKYFTLSPSANYREYWYFSSVRKEWDGQDSVVERTEVPGFVRGGNGNGSVNMTTKIYGTLQNKRGYLRAFRHVMTPGVGFTYTPENRQGITSYTDTLGNEVEYSIFEGGIVGQPNGRESGNIGFSLLNSFEAKVKTNSDTADGLKKIKLLENFRIQSGYDLIKDSLKWNDVTIRGFTQLTKNIDLNFGSTYSLYALSPDLGEGTSPVMINTFEWNQNRRLARMTRADMAVNFNFAGGKQGTQKNNREIEKNRRENESLRRSGYIVEWDVPWTINLAYTVSYDKPTYETTVNQSLRFNGNLSITKNWKVDANGYYNFENQDIEYMTVGIIRNLHCWEMSMNWTPIAQSNRQQYRFNIKVKANILEPLKFEKQGF